MAYADGMSGSCVINYSGFEIKAIRKWQKANCDRHHVLSEITDTHETDTFVGTYDTLECSVWVPSAKLESFFRFLDSLPTRRNLIYFNGEMSELVSEAAAPFNHHVAIGRGPKEFDAVLSIQDTPKLETIKALLALSSTAVMVA